MTKSPVLWGAGLVLAAGAAAAGNALGSLDPVDRGYALAYWQDHPVPSTGRNPRPIAATPDRYPLVTPAGTVPVDRLADRGLYSQRRYREVFAEASGFRIDTDQPSVDEPREAMVETRLAKAEEPLPVVSPAP